MKLTGVQFKQIQEALLAAFDEAGLRQMVRVGLGEDLPQVAGGQNLTEIVSNLVTWAERQNRVQDLINAALTENPHNTTLQALQQASQSWHVAPPAGGKEPYKGLDFFDVGDADLFFGRARLTAELVAYLCDHRLLAVVGASGSGKSSLVRAGMVPALQTGKHLQQDDQRPAGSQRWPVHILTPTAHPLKELSASLTRERDSVTAQATLMDDMAADTRSVDLYGSRMLARLGESASRPERLLLVVDQFEELFTLCRDQDERKAFVDNLLTAAAPDGVTTVVLTLRADFYAHCAQFDNLRQALESSQRYIGTMNEAELRLAIEAPAQQGGWDLELGLVELMLEDVADEPGALPLLSHALLETWKRRTGRTLTLAGYQASGRVQGAIAKTADDTLAALTPPQQAIARRIFLRLTTLGEGVQDTRRRVLLDELMPGPAAATDLVTVLQRLQSARLVTTVREEEPSRVGGESAPITYVDVAHEALIREWPALGEWLAENREGLRVHRRLTEAVQEWVRLGKDPGALYRGLRLAQTLAWAKEHDADLNEQERAFLDASQATVEAEQEERERIGREREAARQRELEAARALAAEAEARRAEEVKARNHVRWAFGAALIAFVLAVAVGWFLYRQNLELRGASLLREAQVAREARDVNTAIAKFTAAAQADSALGIDVAKEISETLRYAALQLIYEGEKLAVQGNVTGAGAKFEEALALNPPPDTPVYVWIQEGEFLMGSDPEMDSLAAEMEDSLAADTEFSRAPLPYDDSFGFFPDSEAQHDEFPQHSVPLDGYWIMRTEVTNEQYARCVEVGVCRSPLNERWHRAEYAREPVINVDWTQASTYAEWVGGRLPSEAEWEKACRGTDGRIYPWGNEVPEPTRSNYSASGLKGVIQIGSYPAGANGLYDMSGNVWEWTSSKYMPYPYDPQDGREDLEGEDDRTLRGGSWKSIEFRLRCAHRLNNSRDYYYSFTTEMARDPSSYYYLIIDTDNSGIRVVVSPGR
jgi:formylglycine-generating enzyme required for sulfatase activity